MICKRKVLPLSRHISIYKSFPFPSHVEMILANLCANEGTQFSVLVNPVRILNEQKIFERFLFPI